jgi:hypothetical protein
MTDFNAGRHFPIARKFRFNSRFVAHQKKGLYPGKTAGRFHGPFYDFTRGEIATHGIYRDTHEITRQNQKQ